MEDGSVVGSFGWVDANQLLRITDFVADDRGYRVVKNRIFKVTNNWKNSKKTKTTPVTQSFIPTEAGPLKVPFAHVRQVGRKRKPINRKPVFSNDIDAPKPVFRKPGLTNDVGPTNPRLQRRVSTGNVIDVQPLFGGLPEDNEVKVKVKVKPEQSQFFQKLQPRGEGSRLRYRPNLPRNDKSVTRFGERPTAKGRIFVVKRRRKPEDILNRKPNPSKIALDYQTEKQYHREKISPQTGERVGEYGYIDPLGVRRVVTYATGGRRKPELVKEKENDFVGVNTYFDSI